MWRHFSERQRRRRSLSAVASARCRVDFSLPHQTPGAADSQARQARYMATLSSFARPLRVVFSEHHFLIETQLNSAKIAPLDEPFFIFNFQRCGGSLVNGGDDGDPEAPLLPHAAALISACRIEPQVPQTAKRAKHVVQRRYPPLRALSGLYFLNLTFF